MSETNIIAAGKHKLDVAINGDRKRWRFDNSATGIIKDATLSSGRADFRFPFLNLTPGPSPFSSTKITPAFSKARMILSRVAAYPPGPLPSVVSSRAMVGFDTPWNGAE